MILTGSGVIMKMEGCCGTQIIYTHSTSLSLVCRENGARLSLERG